MSSLLVFRASAGSGKTYRLICEYITLLFKNPVYYSQTLAITFTNKATAEMRSRIVIALHGLAIGSGSTRGLLQHLCDELNCNEKNVISKAGQLLGMILHDYSKFSVSTIDSFFQKITRSFTRELGLPANFRLEMETDYLLSQAIDLLLVSLNHPGNKDVKDWITGYVIERIESEKGWDIHDELEGICREIFKEHYQVSAQSLDSNAGSKETIARYKKNLINLTSEVENELKQIGRSGLELISRHGLNLSADFRGASRTPVKVFEDLANFKDQVKPEKISNLMGGVDQLTRKDNPGWKNKAIETVYNSGLNALLSRVNDIFNTSYRDYKTAKVITRELNALGLINDVNEKLTEICRDQNVFLIPGTNQLLSKVINQNESPFIYEKTGSRYYNYMIDEFQDTSFLQYKNLTPLLTDSLANGKYALLVGDVKQAIYRWRNSDWNLLAGAIDKDFGYFGVNSSFLDTNWRSHEDVTRFNNMFFEMASETLQQQFNQQLPPEASIAETDPVKSKIRSLYSDIVQNISPSNRGSGGELHIELIRDEQEIDFVEEAIKMTVNRVNQHLASGYNLSDITVLTRTNKEAILITKALLAGHHNHGGKPLPVISNESLVIGNSMSARLLVSMLRVVLEPSNPVYTSFARLNWLAYSCNEVGYTGTPVDISRFFHDPGYAGKWELIQKKASELKEKPVYDLLEEFTRMLPMELLSSELIFIQALLSLALKFISEESADLKKFLEYWDKRGRNVSLSFPANQDAIRVMTIHKSKGLEFKAVIIPFATWEIYNTRNRGLLWIKPRKEPFNDLQLVPVRNTKALASTHFASDYLLEILNQYIDNLNITYVAFTRAKVSLTVFGIASREDKEREIDNISRLLERFLSDSNIGGRFPGCQFEPGVKFHYARTKFNEAVTSTKELPDYQFELSRPVSEVTIRDIYMPQRVKSIVTHLESEETLEGTTINLSRGKIMHRILEQVVTSNDLEKALADARLNGYISSSDSVALKKEVLALLDHPEAREWFNGSYTVKTEPAIFCNGIKRPDRVMIKESNVIVVDYKFGESRSISHVKQVQNYMRLISGMGYSGTRGFIWYAASNDIIEVTTQPGLFDNDNWQ